MGPMGMIVLWSIGKIRRLMMKSSRQIMRWSGVDTFLELVVTWIIWSHENHKKTIWIVAAYISSTKTKWNESKSLHKYNIWMRWDVCNCFHSVASMKIKGKLPVFIQSSTPIMWCTHICTIEDYVGTILFMSNASRKKTKWRGTGQMREKEK